MKCRSNPSLSSLPIEATFLATSGASTLMLAEMGASSVWAKEHHVNNFLAMCFQFSDPGRPTASPLLNRLSRGLSQSPHNKQCSATHNRPSVSLSHCSADSNLDLSWRLHTHQMGTLIIVPFTGVFLWIVSRQVFRSVLPPVALPVITPLFRPILINIRSSSRPADRWNRRRIHRFSCDPAVDQQTGGTGEEFTASTRCDPEDPGLETTLHHVPSVFVLPLMALSFLVTPSPTVSTVATKWFSPPLLTLLIPPTTVSFPTVAFSFLFSFLFSFHSFTFAFSFPLSLLSILSFAVPFLLPRSVPPKRGHGCIRITSSSAHRCNFPLAAFDERKLFVSGTSAG